MGLSAYHTPCWHDHIIFAWLRSGTGVRSVQRIHIHTHLRHLLYTQVLSTLFLQFLGMRLFSFCLTCDVGAQHFLLPSNAPVPLCVWRVVVPVGWLWFNLFLGAFHRGWLCVSTKQAEGWSHNVKLGDNEPFGYLSSEIASNKCPLDLINYS